MQKVRDEIARLGRTNLPVLILGETGVGKELAARATHAVSGRTTFVPVNCAALPEPLFESEMFGYLRGAFTSAERNKPGLLEVADGGTLFLDEVGELPQLPQAKLLRALEGGEVRRVGDNRTRHVNVRVIAATNRDLKRDMLEGRFRADLYWRLKGVSLRIPPLRERHEDVPVLARDFAGHVLISEGATSALAAHSWPGNVRELRAAIEYAVAFAADRILPEHLPTDITRNVLASVRPPYTGRTRLASLRELTHEYIIEIVRLCDGNHTRAATILGIDPKTLRRKLRVAENL